MHFAKTKQQNKFCYHCEVDRTHRTLLFFLLQLISMVVEEKNVWPVKLGRYLNIEARKRGIIHGE